MASLLSRVSFEAQLSAVRERENSGLIPWLLFVVLLFAVPFTVVHLMPSFEWRLILYAEAAIALLLLLARITRIRRFARQIGLVCPDCNKDLWGSGPRYGPTLQQTVLEQGLCPHCRARLMDPADVQQVSVQAPVSKARNVAGVMALLGLTVGFLLYADAHFVARRVIVARTSIEQRAHCRTRSVLIARGHSYGSVVSFECGISERLPNTRLKLAAPRAHGLRFTG